MRYEYILLVFLVGLWLGLVLGLACCAYDRSRENRRG